MSFTTEGSQAFLSANDEDDEAANLAALDSMTSGMSNQSAFMSQQMSSGGTNTAMTPTTTTTTTTAATNNNGGEMGESLFDRIRRRTEEQQRQQQAQAQAAAQAQSSSNTTASQQPTSTTTESNNTHNIAGLEHEPSDGSIPPTSASTAFDAAVQSAANPTTTTTEQTYAFTATTGEDFSFQPHQQPPSIPTYGPSRNDPSYYSANNNTPSSLQDRAAMAFNDAGDTMKSLFHKGMNGANSLVASAQSKFGAGGGGGTGSGYTNNFLLREDSMEQGGAPTPPTTAEPMQMNASSSGGTSELNQVSGQAYSMISYAKIFCEDLYGFLMQLPPLGKVGVLVVLIALWLLMRG